MIVKRARSPYFRATILALVLTDSLVTRHPEAKSDLDQFDDIGDDVRFQ
jgi:hypothetical protein